MRESRFTDEQRVTILREAGRSSAGAVAKKRKVSEQTIYARPNVWPLRLAGSRKYSQDENQVTLTPTMTSISNAAHVVARSRT